VARLCASIGADAIAVASDSDYLFMPSVERLLRFDTVAASPETGIVSGVVFHQPAAKLQRAFSRALERGISIIAVETLPAVATCSYDAVRTALSQVGPTFGADQVDSVVDVLTSGLISSVELWSEFLEDFCATAAARDGPWPDVLRGLVRAVLRNDWRGLGQVERRDATFIFVASSGEHFGEPRASHAHAARDGAAHVLKSISLVAQSTVGSLAESHEAPGDGSGAEGEEVGRESAREDLESLEPAPAVDPSGDAASDEKKRLQLLLETAATESAALAAQSVGGVAAGMGAAAKAAGAAGTRASRALNDDDDEDTQVHYLERLANLAEDLVVRRRRSGRETIHSLEVNEQQAFQWMAARPDSELSRLWASCALSKLCWRVVIGGQAVDALHRSPTISSSAKLMFALVDVLAERVRRRSAFPVSVERFPLAEKADLLDAVGAFERFTKLRVTAMTSDDAWGVAVGLVARFDPVRAAFSRGAVAARALRTSAPSGFRCVADGECRDATEAHLIRSLTHANEVAGAVALFCELAWAERGAASDEPRLLDASNVTLDASAFLCTVRALREIGGSLDVFAARAPDPDGFHGAFERVRAVVAGVAPRSSLASVKLNGAVSTAVVGEDDWDRDPGLVVVPFPPELGRVWPACVRTARCVGRRAGRWVLKDAQTQAMCECREDDLSGGLFSELRWGDRVEVFRPRTGSDDVVWARCVERKRYDGVVVCVKPSDRDPSVLRGRVKVSGIQGVRAELGLSPGEDSLVFYAPKQRRGLVGESLVRFAVRFRDGKLPIAVDVEGC